MLRKTQHRWWFHCLFVCTNYCLVI